MKSFKIVCFLLFVIMMSTEFSQAQWILQNDSLQASSGINDICIINLNVVWALDYSGATPSKLRRSFIRTIDGGNSWKLDSVKTSISLPPDQGLTNISAINPDTAWVATYSPANTTISGVFRTNDGGVSWTKQNSAAFNVNSFPDFIHFWDKNNGIVFADPNPSAFEIYTTTDGGATWVSVPSANIAAPLSNEYGVTGCYAVIGNTVWEATSSGRVLKSADMGLHWTVSTILANKQLNTLTFKDQNTGLCQVGAKNDTLMRTTDGGATWTIVNLTGAYLKGDLCYAPGINPMFVSVGASFVLGTSYSTDDGTTWTSIESTDRHTCVSFLNTSIGWSGAFTSPTAGGGMFKWSSNIGIEEYKNILGLKLYPNPNNGTFHITQENAKNGSTQISVCDLVGKIVYNTSMRINTTEEDLDLTSQPKGLYFVRVINSKGESAVQKLIIE
jgi:photosystem II stability/assembly factor-like uncharacterized protein